MPLDKRYNSSDVRAVLDASKLNKSSDKFTPEGFCIKVPSYYTTNTAIVIAPSTDTKNHKAQMLQTIKKGLSRLKKENIGDKKIYIPVAEEQKILGLFKRNHWVTLEYDPKKQQATLLDSRPWIISFLYPCKAMKNQLKEGLKKIYEEDIEISFKKKYQGVQRNDIHCGAWTSQNILDLSGVNSDKPTTIEEQKNKYKRTDEKEIVTSNIEIAKQGKNRLDTHNSSPKKIGKLGGKNQKNNNSFIDKRSFKDTKSFSSLQNQDDFENISADINSFRY